VVQKVIRVDLQEKTYRLSVVPKLSYGIQEGNSYWLDYKHEYLHNYKADHILYATGRYSVPHSTFSNGARHKC